MLVVGHASDVAGNEAIGSTAVSRCEAEDEDACAGPGMDCEADPGSEAPDILQVFRVRLTGMVRQMCHDGAGKDKLEPKNGGCRWVCEWVQVCVWMSGATMDESPTGFRYHCHWWSAVNSIVCVNGWSINGSKSDRLQVRPSHVRMHIRRPLIPCRCHSSLLAWPLVHEVSGG